MHSIFVWTLDDIFGLVFLALLLLGGLTIIVVAYFEELKLRWRARKERP